MKQKNLILVAVAVGCGLVAAFLTTQIGAKPAQSEQYEVPVAAKDLPVGTKLSKDDIDQLVVMKKIPKDALPAAFAATKEEMADKRLARTIRMGETFNPQDLTTSVTLTPPPGMDVMTIQGNAEKSVAGFAGPGSKVDILAAVRQRSSEKTTVFVLLTDMLVLAIDSNKDYPNGQQTFANLSTVSLAVDPEQALLLHGAINRGADLRLVLRHPDKAPVTQMLPREEIWKILSDDTSPRGGADSKTETVKLPVAIEDLPAGTQLTSDVIAKKFKLVDHTIPAPASFVKDLKEHEGKFLQKELSADQFVPKTYVADKPKEPDVVPPAPKVEDAAKPPAEPKEYWDTTVQTSSGVRKYRYEKAKDGEYRYVGEVKEEGAAQPAPESKPESKRPDGAPA